MDDLTDLKNQMILDKTKELVEIFMDFAHDKHGDR